MGKRKQGEKNTLHGAGMGMFLIGIGIIFLLEVDFWPWILVVLGLSGLPSSVAEEGLWAGLQGLVWAVGLAILFALDAFWPGILIVIGASILMGALARPPIFDESKPKRGLPSEEQ